jgi:hypothetical protein
MSSFLFVADFDFEDILKEYPDLFGNMENESNKNDDILSL